MAQKVRRWGSGGNQVAWKNLTARIACRCLRTGPDLYINLLAPSWHTTEIQVGKDVTTAAFWKVIDGHERGHRPLSVGVSQTPL